MVYYRCTEIGNVYHIFLSKSVKIKHYTALLGLLTRFIVQLRHPAMIYFP